MWLELAVVTAAIYAFVSLLDKAVSDLEFPDPAAAMAINGLPRFLTFVIIGAIGGDLFLGSVDGLWARRTIAWAGLACGVFYAAAMVVWYRGLAESDLSTFVPLFATRTIFTTMLAFLFLGESFPLIIYLAIGLIVAGAMLISVQPDDDGFGGVTIQSTDTVALSLLAAGMFAGIYTALGGITGAADVWSVLFWIGIGGTVVSLDLAVLRRNELFELTPRSQAALVANGGLSAIAFFTFTLAVAAGPVALVTALVNLDAVIVFVVAVTVSRLVPHTIDEPTGPGIVLQKGIATVLIIGGGVIITFAQ